MRQLFLIIWASALVVLANLAFPQPAGATAMITVANLDGPDEGFNDPTMAAPVGGNPGTTIGQQRLVAFQHVANIWASLITSPVEIRVEAKFDPLSCSTNSGVLGSAGPNTLHGNFAGAPVSNTWYVQALANSLFGGDLGVGSNDIGATFSSTIGTPGCLENSGWYYGLDASPPVGKIDFVTVLLHELGHGLGFLSLVNLSTGQKLNGFDDAYMRFLEDHSTGKLYPQMTDAERLGASTNTGNLHWTGLNVVAGSGGLTAGRHPSGDVQMYAPNPAQSGSSVSHYDTALSPNELMEPSYTGPLHDVGLTLELFADLGWVIASNPPLPEVTIAATDNTATEQGPTTGTLTVSRAGSTAASLTIFYSVSGTATAVSDYQTLSGSVMIPVGQSSATITITPIVDAILDEGDETVIATLSANAAYTVGAPDNATVTITENGTAPADFDGDGKTDLAVYQTSTGNWFYVGSTSGSGQHLNFGGVNFLPVPGDYDGDGVSDTAVYDSTNGNWFIDQSTAGFRIHSSFGGAGFVPVPGDYDGDGKTDVSVYQTSTGHWFFVGSTSGFGQHLAFGGSGYIPVPGDYDGDGHTDTAVYQTSTGHWFIAQSTAGFKIHGNFGGAGFIPVSGDYDGDGKMDVGVYQTGTGHWFWVGSTDGFSQHRNFGGSGYMPVAGDYDGDGQTDRAVYQTATGHWFIAQSLAGFRVHSSFGGSGFVPVLPQVTILRALGLL